MAKRKKLKIVLTQTEDGDNGLMVSLLTVIAEYLKAHAPGVEANLEHDG